MILRFKAFAPLLPLVAIMAFASVFSAVAQERTAGSTVETQMTWTSLVSQINAVKNTVILTNNRVDAGVACGKKGMVYAPGMSADGCIEASKANDTTSNITKLYTLMNTTKTSVDNMLACMKAGQTYNGTGCVPNTATSSGTVAIDYGSCSLATNSVGKSNGAGRALGMSINTNYAGEWYCPSGMTMVGVNNNYVGSALCCKLKYTSSK